MSRACIQHATFSGRQALLAWTRSHGAHPAARRRRTSITRARASQEPQPPPQSLQSGWSTDLELPVPSEQRPVNELSALKKSPLFSWASLELSAYVQRLLLVWTGAVLLLSAPVAAGSFDPAKQPVEFALAAATGGLIAVVVVSLRLYLGYAYVGNRLLSATVEYEETGWYDGQIFLKPPSILTRDRLLGSYEVKPVLARLRQTLVGAASGLTLSSLVLAGVIQVNGPPSYSGQIPQPREVFANGMLYSDKATSLEQLRDDDEAAEAEALAQGGVPGYCADRYYRAAAGGSFCAKFERAR